MITIYKEPKKFNQVRQTIPFLVGSNIFSTIPNFDPIERSFKYVFEIKTMRADGTYKTYAKVAIPPRPDNLLGFFDASAIIKSAITYDLGTHIATTAQPCPKSIVQFMVICTERFLDTNGNYTTATSELIGQYYAIDMGVNESINEYLMDYNVQASPLHHHFLATTDLRVYANEPFSFSWLVEPKESGNMLDFASCDYGSFDNGVIGDYTNLSASTFTQSLALATSLAQSGRSLNVLTKPTAFTTSTTSASLFTINNLILEDNASYTFKIYVRTPTSYIPNNNAWNLEAIAAGIKIAGTTTTVKNVWLAGIGWQELTCAFQTNANVASVTLNVRINMGGGTTNLALNNKNFYFDSANLFQKLSTTDVLSSGQIIVDDGLPTVQTWNIPFTYFTTNLLPVTTFADGRFDTPVGPYSGILTGVVGAQDVATGFYKNSAGQIGQHFRLKLRDNTNATIGLTEKVYQDLDDCNKYTPIKLKWKNSLGGWDFMTFTKVSSAVTNIERENYKRSRGQIAASGTGYNYLESDNDRGYKSLNIKLKDTFSIASDWIEKDTAKWLQDLYTSDEVYILNPEVFQKFVVNSPFDTEYPVFVQQTDVEYQSNAGDRRLVNVIIDVTPAVRFEENTTNI